MMMMMMIPMRIIIPKITVISAAGLFGLLRLLWALLPRVAELLACAASAPSCPVRDLLARQDVAPLAAAAALTAVVASHGVQMFLIG